MLDVAFKDFPKELKKLVNFAMPTPGLVLHVADGDTLTIFMARRFYDSAIKRLRIRKINAPELGTPEGRAARDYLVSLLPIGTPLIVVTFKQTFDRYESDVRFLKDGVVADLATEIVNAGHAVRVK